MCLLLETLRAVDGEIENIEDHEQRMMRSRKELWKVTDPVYLTDAIELSGLETGKGIWKIRILYNSIIQKIEAVPYQMPAYNKVALVDHNHINYSYKWADRPVLNELQNRALTVGADTALIVKNGKITDFIYANAVFSDGVYWFTPRHPLLKGTCRERLLRSGRIQEADIFSHEIMNFQSLCPISSMIDLGDVSISPRHVFSAVL